MGSEMLGPIPSEVLLSSAAITNHVAFSSILSDSVELQLLKTILLFNNSVLTMKKDWRYMLLFFILQEKWEQRKLRD